MFINPNEYGSLLFNSKEINAVNNVLKNEKIFRYSSEKESKVDEFEKKLSNFVGSKYSLALINGTAGLITALIGCGVEKGDRVLVSSYTFLATALAVKNIGAIPIPIEIDLINGFDLEDYERELKKGCKAAIVVQHQGRCFNLNKVIELSKKYNVVLIEDSCQALGSKNDVGYAGTLADIGVYSFQQFKQITCGEGGAVVTNNKKYYQRMRNYTDMGSNRDMFPIWKGENVLFGQNYRMNNISAAILCEQLKKLPKIIDKQRKSRQYILDKVLSDKIINSYHDKGDTGMNIFILLQDKYQYDDLKKIGSLHNIEVRKMWNGLYFDNELFKNNKLTDLDLKGNECKKTKDIVNRLALISIPPVLTRSNCDKIIDFLKSSI